MIASGRGRKFSTLSGTAFTLVVLVVLVLISLLIAGCSSGGDASPTTSATEEDTDTTEADTSTSTEPELMSPEERALTDELRETAQAAASMSMELEQQGVHAMDPEATPLYALRARSQAVTARLALVQNRPGMADQAVRELRALMARAKNAAGEELPSGIASAQDHLAELGLPSEDPERSADILDEIIDELAFLTD